jgi:hypothetical protein
LGYDGLGQDWLGWLLFFVRHITALSQPKKIGKIFIQIQVFAELWVSWAGLNLLFLIFSHVGGLQQKPLGPSAQLSPALETGEKNNSKFGQQPNSPFPNGPNF